MNRQLRYLTAFVSAAKTLNQSWEKFHEMDQRGYRNGTQNELHPQLFQAQQRSGACARRRPGYSAGAV